MTESTGVIEALFDSDAQGNQGELPRFAWPGAYSIFYLTKDGDVLCAECASRDLREYHSGEGYDPPVGYGAFGATEDYPADDVRCDDCNHLIYEVDEPSTY